MWGAGPGSPRGPCSPSLAAAALAKEGRREKAYVRALLRAERFARFLEARFRSR
jgi:hypothetical protein